MIYPTRRYVPLDSMGLVLDNVGNTSQEQFLFQPSDGCLVFDPSAEKIKTYAGDFPNTIVTSSRDVSDSELYLNRITKRAYFWDGNEMVEANLSVPETSTVPTCDTDFSQDDAVYNITDVVNVSEMSNRVIGDNVTLVFYEGGCLVGGTLQGKYTSITDANDPNYGKLCNVMVVVKGEQVIFDSCTFTGCRFVDSELFATNFGAQADWDVEYVAINIKNLTFNNLPIFNGTDNTSAFSKIGQFLSNSTNLHFVLNGSFFSSVVDPNLRHINIHNAEGLVMEGRGDCKIIHGVRLTDCNDVEIHHISFVGLHTLHDFPTIYIGKSNINSSNWEQKRSASTFLQNYATYEDFNQMTFESNPPSETLASIGVSDSAILVNRNDPNADCGNVRIHDCHFEMRQDGVVASSYRNSNTHEVRPLRHVHVHDCTFDHIYFQAVESYCEYALFEHIEANYCLQGLDISTCGNHTVVRDCRFTHCAKGSKQESGSGFEDYSHHNVIENCYFQIDDTVPFHNISKFAFQVHKGPEGDTFVMRDCEIDINVQQRYTGLLCRSWAALFERVTFHFAAPAPRPDGLSNIEMLISSHDSNSHECLARFVGCTFEIDCSVFDFYYYSGHHMQLSMEDTVITGTGLIKNAIARLCKQLVMKGCTVDINHKMIAYDCKDVDLSSCVFSQSSDAVFQRPSAAQFYSMTVRADHCSFSSPKNLVDLKASNGSYTFKSCRISARSVMQKVLAGNGNQTYEHTSLSVTECSIRISSSMVVDGFTLSEIEGYMTFSNNVLSSSSLAMISASSNGGPTAASPKAAAHVFYNNFLCRNIAPVNEGDPVSNLPEKPWEGMVYYDTTQNQLIFRSGNSWSTTPPA